MDSFSSFDSPDVISPVDAQPSAPETPLQPVKKSDVIKPLPQKIQEAKEKAETEEPIRAEVEQYVDTYPEKLGLEKADLATINQAKEYIFQIYFDLKKANKIENIEKYADGTHIDWKSFLESNFKFIEKNEKKIHKENYQNFIQAKKEEGWGNRKILEALLSSREDRIKLDSELGDFDMPAESRVDFEKLLQLSQMQLGADNAPVDKFIGEALASGRTFDQTLQRVFESTDISDETKERIRLAFPGIPRRKLFTGTDVKDSLAEQEKAHTTLKNKQTEIETRLQTLEEQIAAKKDGIEALKAQTPRPDDYETRLSKLESELKKLEDQLAQTKELRAENENELEKIETDEKGHVRIPLRDGTATLESEGDKKMLRVHYGGSNIRIPYNERFLFDGNRVRDNINTLYVYEKMNATHRKPGLARAIFKNFESGTDPPKHHEEIARMVIDELGFKEGSRKILSGSRLKNSSSTFQCPPPINFTLCFTIPSTLQL